MGARRAFAAARRSRSPSSIAENLRRLRDRGEEVGRELRVDGGPRHQRGAVAHRAGHLVEERIVARSEREVLRRGRRVGDEPAVLRMRNEQVQQELGRAFHDRVRLRQERLIAREPVVLPEVSGQPGAARGEPAPVRPVHRRGHTPDVGVLVVHPAARAVMFTGDGRALVGQFPDHPEQRLGALGQVRHLGRPVVHLGVDVRRVLRIPHGIHVLVPDPLQVGGLRPRPRRRDQHVAAELEQERGEGRIVGAVELLQALVGGQRGIGRRAEIEAHAPEEAPVLGDVRGLEALVGLRRRRAQHALHARVGICTDVLVVHETGRGCDEERDARRLADGQAIAVGADVPPVRYGSKPGRVSQAPGDAQVICRLAPDNQAVRAVGVHPEVVRGVVGVRLVSFAAQLDREGKAPGGLGRQPDHDHLVDGRAEDLAPVLRAVPLVDRRHHGRVEVEFMTVARVGTACRERQHEASHRLVLLLLDRVSHQVAAEEPVGLDELAVEQQAADLRKGLVAAGHGGRIGAARPVRVLVELDGLLVGAPEHHRPQAPVADRQRVLPLLGRVGVPENRA